MLWLLITGTCSRRVQASHVDKESFKLFDRNDGQLSIARRSGFSTLPTWELFQKSDVCRIDPAAYPVCVRPSRRQEVELSIGEK